MPRHSEPLTVGMLIEKLKDYSPDTEVYFTYDYGDHWHSQVAQPVNSVYTDYITYSEYHKMMAIASNENEDPDDNENEDPEDLDETKKEVLILN
jgi:hypothetical protein